LFSRPVAVLQRVKREPLATVNYVPARRDIHRKQVYRDMTEEFSTADLIEAARIQNLPTGSDGQVDLLPTTMRGHIYLR
jgi:hypothetical protein